LLRINDGGARDATIAHLVARAATRTSLSRHLLGSRFAFDDGGLEDLSEILIRSVIREIVSVLHSILHNVEPHPVGEIGVDLQSCGANGIKVGCQACQVVDNNFFFLC
jgi:hypothetical protein